MRLIKLSANQPKFKTVCFNETGISLIIAQKENSEVQHDDRSYNGVGKSLLVELIHFCLGSNKNSAFSEHLPGWEFTLVFKIKDDLYVSSRSTDRQKEIFLNDRVCKLKEFNDFLEKSIFNISEPISILSFRSLFPKFIRRRKEDYYDPRRTSVDKEDYALLMRNLFLLGIDTDLAKNKYELTVENKKLKAQKDSFNEDELFRNFRTGNKDDSLEIAHLLEKISHLDKNLSEFKIAEDYHEIENEANYLNQKLIELKNRKVVIENSLYNIQKSIEIKPDLSKEKLLSLYQEIINIFKADALKQIEDVENFNQQLIKNRLNRLNKEKLELKAELEEANSKIDSLSLKLNEKLSYLSDKRALDQYVAVSQQKTEWVIKLQKIKDYQTVLHEIDGNLLKIKKKLAEEDIKTNQYLEETEQEREKSFSVFSRLVKRIYPHAPAGVSLKNNTGNNKLRYDLDVRIEADGSDGINSAKIFCYDLFLMLLANNHNIQFVWHDSRLFGGIDPRQRAILFKLAYENSKNKQYIATINQDEVESMRSEFTPSEFAEIFNENIVLTLKDDKDESKLLGGKIDMHYIS